MVFLTGKDIEKASLRIETHINKTPVMNSSLLNSMLGHEVYFKAECFQKTGAFKARGACNTIARWIEEGQKPEHIIAVSSGNHAQAVAWAAKRFGIPATLFLPAYSSKIKIQATVAYGANTVLCESRADADEKVNEASAKKGTCFVPPFNHDYVIAGQGTAVFEALQEIGEVDAVFAPCGGGGLLSGSYIAARHLSPKAEVIGAEPLNANDAVQSIRTGTIQKLSGVPDTLADGAMTPAVGDITFEYLKQLDDLYEIEESRIIYWTQWLSHLLKIRVEPTSATAMEAAYRRLKRETSKKRVLVLLSGGNIDQETSLKIWKTNTLSELPRI
jgi:threonine dehydratase